MNPSLLEYNIACECTCYPIACTLIEDAENNDALPMFLVVFLKRQSLFCVSLHHDETKPILESMLYTYIS